jgi:hypothetical protein
MIIITMSSSLKWSFFGVTILTVCISIIGLVLLSLVYNNYGSEYTFYQAVKKNVDQGPIYSVISQNSPCVGRLSPLLNLRWGGIKRICKCLLGSSGSACSSKQLRSGCYNTGSVMPIEYARYKGVYLCAERYSATYDSIVEVTPASACPEGTRLCGKFGDGFKLCYSKDQRCPVNDILFSSSVRPDLIARGYSEVPVVYDAPSYLDLNSNITNRNSWYIYYSFSEIEKQLVSEFRMGYKNQTCFHPAEKIVPKEQYEFLNEIDQLVSSCSNIASQVFDNSTRYLDTYSMYNLWLENAVLSSMNGVTPGFEPESVIYDFDLFARGYYHISEECLYDGATKVFNRKSDIISLLSFVDDSYNKRAFYIAVMIFLAIVFAVAVTLMIFLLCDKKLGGFHFIMSGVAIIMLIVVLGLIAAMLAKHRGQFDQLNLLTQRTCGDVQIASAISNSASVTSSSDQYLVAMIVLTVLVILFLTAFTIVGLINR